MLVGDVAPPPTDTDAAPEASHAVPSAEPLSSNGSPLPTPADPTGPPAFSGPPSAAAIAYPSPLIGSLTQAVHHTAPISAFLCPTPLAAVDVQPSAVFGALSPNPSNAADPLPASDTCSISAADSADPACQSPTPSGANIAEPEAASTPPAASDMQHISAPGNAGSADSAEPFPASDTSTDAPAANNNAAVQQAPDLSTDGASQTSDLLQADVQHQTTQADGSLQASNAAWSPSQEGASLHSDLDTSNAPEASSTMIVPIESTSAPGSPTESTEQLPIRRTASDISAAGKSINQVPAQAHDNLQQHQPAQQPEDDREEDDQEVDSDTDSDIAAQLVNINDGAAAPECAVPNDGANAENPPTAPPGSHGPQSSGNFNRTNMVHPQPTFILWWSPVSSFLDMAHSQEQ